MKKKVFAVSLVVALLAIFVVGGSLAWFTAEDEVTNTFTIGSVKIEVEEKFDEEDAKGMLPIVNTNSPESDPNYVNKDAWTNNIGKNPAYIQMFVAIPKVLDDAKAIIVVDSNAAGWGARTAAGTTIFDGVTYNVYRYQYSDKVAAGGKTTEVITGVYLSENLDYDNDRNRFVMDGVELNGYVPGEAISIYVGAQAIQSEGFGSAEEALATFDNTTPWNP